MSHVQALSPEPSQAPLRLAQQKLRIALVGTRGPGFYGGFETCVAEIAPRLAGLDHDVTVYARRTAQASTWSHPGVRVVTLPSLRTKNLDTITHTAVSSAHLLTQRADVAIFFGVGNAPLAALVRRMGVPVVFNVDGLDRERRKWSRFARTYLHKAERWAIGASDVLVTDARTIERYYRDEYGAESTFISYGAPDGPVRSTTTVREAGLDPQRYILYVSRLEPENNADVLIDAYGRAGIDQPLAVVGGSTYTDEYERQLRRAAGPGVHFLGGVYGRGYRELQSHAMAYVQCTEVGGSHPALIEAMAYANPIIALDTPEHREVLGDAGLYYRRVDELAAHLRTVSSRPLLRTQLAAAAQKRARELFAWDRVTESYVKASEVAIRRHHARVGGLVVPEPAAEMPGLAGVL